jgi:hypothetical protein
VTSIGLKGAFSDAFPSGKNIYFYISSFIKVLRRCKSNIISKKTIIEREAL